MNIDMYDEIYVKLKKKIIISYISSWTFVLAMEIIVALVLHLTDYLDINLTYILLYIILPCGVNALIIAITLLLITDDKLPLHIKNYVLVTSLVFISMVLSIVHGYFTVLLALYCLPIFVATVFLDKRIMIYAMSASSVGVIISSVIIALTEKTLSTDYIILSAVIALLFLILVSLLCYLVFHIHKDRENMLASVQSENSKLSKETRFDGLTGLQNHTSFYNVFEHKLMKSRHDHKGFALAMIDIDDFKSVNDSFGHSKGDEIIRFVSQSISDSIGKSGIAFRYGGDEFSIIFQNPNPEENVSMLENLRTMVNSTHTLFDEDRVISLSIGYYNVKEVSMTAEEIFYKADQALYQAKYSGKNQVHADY